jgi:dienelactone hydrolase
VKLRAWILRKACAGVIGAGLAGSGLCVAAGPAIPASSAKVIGSGLKSESSENAPLALRGTALLDHAENIQGVDGNPAAMIDQREYGQVRNYFLKQIAATPAKREKLWQPDFSSRSAYESSVSEHRQHLRKMLGLVEVNPQKAEVAILAESGGVRVEEVKIALDGDFAAQALVFLPENSGRKAALIAIPQADESPEEFAGIAEGMTTSDWLRKLLGRGVAVAIPEMVERRSDHPLCLEAGGHDRRRMLWRLGFIVGRTLVGMEIQQVMALGDYLAAQPEIDRKKIGVWGEGQGGMTAFYAAAMDERLAGATVQDYFQQREESWKEPIDRLLYGQLNEFGDAEIAALIAPRPLTIVTQWGGPVNFESMRTEIGRARRFYRGLGMEDELVTKEEASGAEEASAVEAASMLRARGEENLPEITFRVSSKQTLAMRNEHFEGLYRYAQRLCAESDSVRTAYWKLASTPAQERPEKIAKLRKEEADLVGVIPGGNIPLHPRTLLIGETDKFLAYEVVLDTVPGVEAYGQLLVPRSVAGKVDKRLPAVVCQHGFGGAPKYVSGVGEDVETNDHFYHRFGERLAERGYVVFAPYLTVPEDPARASGENRADLVNPIVREAASLGMMRTSLELAKLHRIVDFLQSLPFVDENRIGYYGLSYGGYSATWMPPLEPRLRFTIISGHFNDWRQELTIPVEDNPSHYWKLPDEDFYNWNALNRFTHTELIAAMWPRPVCIEWGLQDGTTTPERHKQAWEDLKTKFVDPWNMVDKVVDEDYIGLHTIHGVGTFSFIDRWLRPERSAGRDYGCDGEHYCNQDVALGLHGYAPNSEIPYVTQQVDVTPESTIEGRFYVSDVSPELTGMELKVSRVGHPGDLVVELGSRENGSDLGELRLTEMAVYPNHDLWYELKLKHPIRLDPKKLYWFEVRSASGHAPQDSYMVYGPRPLGGTDYPHNFGLSFRMLTQNGK